MTARRGHPEADLQRDLVKLLRAALPFGSIVHACNSEVRGSSDWAQRQQAIAQGMGVYPGFSDLIAFAPSSGDRPGLCMAFEVKTPQGRASRAQMAFASAFEGMGHHYALVRSPEDLFQALRATGLPLRATW